MGNISVPVTDPEYNIGKNIFSNNGNNGELFDLYNNNPNDVMAQNNHWGVPEQIEELIRTVIRDKANDSRYGIVTFMPPYIEEGIKEHTDNVSISPNPASQTVTIIAEKFLKVEIYNIFGQIMDMLTTPIVDVSAYNAGIYFFKVFDSNNCIVIKRVVVRG
jgi:hypothetical protein